MKRKLALFLALVMIMSLIPANVFAASDNSVNKIPKVSDDYDTWIEDADGAAAAPMIRIEEDNGGDFGETEFMFRLKLENAEWDDDSAGLMQDIVDDAGYDLTFTKRSSTSMDVEYDPGTYTTGDDARFVKIPMVVEVTDAGNINVIIDSRETAISDEKITFAIAADGDTVTTIEDTNSFGDTLVLETIEIEELKIGTLEGIQVLFFNYLTTSNGMQIQKVQLTLMMKVTLKTDSSTQVLSMTLKMVKLKSTLTKEDLTLIQMY